MRPYQHNMNQARKTSLPQSSKYSGAMVSDNRVDQCDHRKESMVQQSQKSSPTGSSFTYSGPMVDTTHVDQCEQDSHLTKNEQTGHWQPLGLDHQSGYTYLYQHSGFEKAEQEEERRVQQNSLE